MSLFNDPFWNFFENINEEVRSFNNMFGRQQRLTGKDNNELAASTPRSLDFGRKSWFDRVQMPIDVVDHDKEYEVHVSIAGAKKEDIAIDFNKNTNELLIKGTIPSPVKEEEKEGGKLKYSERVTGSFERRLSLPRVDGDNISAKIEDGVLVLKLPKLGEASDYKRIEISKE